MSTGVKQSVEYIYENTIQLGARRQRLYLAACKWLHATLFKWFSCAYKTLDVHTVDTCMYLSKKGGRQATNARYVLKKNILSGVKPTILKSQIRFVLEPFDFTMFYQVWRLGI